jgi:hypothetical protein
VSSIFLFCFFPIFESIICSPSLSSALLKPPQVSIVLLSSLLLSSALLSSDSFDLIASHLCGPVAQSVDHSARDPKVGSSPPVPVRPKTFKNGDWFVGVSIMLPTVLILLHVERDVKPELNERFSSFLLRSPLLSLVLLCSLFPILYSLWLYSTVLYCQLFSLIFLHFDLCSFLLFSVLLGSSLLPSALLHLALLSCFRLSCHLATKKFQYVIIIKCIL